MDDFRGLLWRLDAWDSLAGYAFLCRRLPDDAQEPKLDQPAVFVCPPFFQPEPLASRAPGLAATRGTLQAGFFIEGQEVGFATLADAIAFVRRAYKSPGSEPFPGAPITRREGPAGGGGSGLARELPELPQAAGYRKLDLAIAACEANFLKASHDAKQDVPAVHLKWAVDLKLTEKTVELLALAGEALMRELLWRFPAKGAAADYSAWLDAAYRFGRQLARLGLWEQVRDTCAKQIKAPIEQLKDIFAIGLPDALPKDFLGREMQWFLDVLFKRPHRLQWDVERTDEATIYEDLALFPLPPSIAPLYPAHSDSVPTVLTLLATWFSHPNSLHKATTFDRALLLFGGACVVVGRLHRESPAFKPWWIDQNSRVKQAFEVRLGSETWGWISKQLPDRVFDYRLEGTLREIPRIWMGINTIGPSDRIVARSISKIDPSGNKYLRRRLGEILSDEEHHEQPDEQHHSEDQNAVEDEQAAPAMRTSYDGP
jgi:hypothetical protein